MPFSERLHEAMRQRLGLDAFDATPVGGGSINHCYRLKAGGRLLFCKTNKAAAYPGLFAAEAYGLRLLASPGVLPTAAVVDRFETDGEQALLLDWIDEGPRTTAFWDAFGTGLAALHRCTAPRFGLDADNYMGSLPQANGWANEWTVFFAERRLLPMALRCHRQGLLSTTEMEQAHRVAENLHRWFEPEPPALVHGDLWSGNFLCDRQQRPVLIDPAAYYGHRSVDLAMTTLFGGFAPAFYDAYHHHYPLPAQHREQWALCNLYPLLVHLSLFGSGYHRQVAQTLARFC